MDPNTNSDPQSTSAPEPQQQGMPQQMPQQQQQMPRSSGVFQFQVPQFQQQFQQHVQSIRKIELQPEPSFAESIPSTADLRQASKPFKIHAAIAVIFSTGMIALWTFLQLWMWTGFPWFFYPVCTCGITLSFHYYLFVRPTKEFLNLHLAWYILINVLLFFTWAANPDNSTWFLFVALAWGIVLVIHFCLIKYKEHPSKWLYTHLAAFITLSLLLFVIYLNQPEKGFAWPIVVMLSLGVGLLVHWNRHYHRENFFRLHVAIYSDVQLLLFLIWEMSGPGIFPFFLPPLFLWTAILALHFWRKSKADAALAKQQGPASPVNEGQTPLMQEQALNPFESPAYGTTPTAYATYPQQTFPQQQYPQVVVLQTPSMYPQVNSGVPQTPVYLQQQPQQHP